jgi:hypothetical protein
LRSFGCIYALLAASLLVLAPIVSAQTADLELSVEVTPPYPWLIGTVGQTVFRIKNFGPNRVSFAAMETSFLPDDFVPLFEFISGDCFTPVSCEQFPPPCVGFGAVAPMQTRECTFVTRAVRRGTQPTSRGRAYDFTFITTDPNPSNNTVQLTPSVIEPPIQVPMSGWAYAAMVLLTLGVGAFAARRYS